MWFSPTQFLIFVYKLWRKRRERALSSPRPCHQHMLRIRKLLIRIQVWISIGIRFRVIILQISRFRYSLIMICKNMDSAKNSNFTSPTSCLLIKKTKTGVKSLFLGSLSYDCLWYLIMLYSIVYQKCIYWNELQFLARSCSQADSGSK